MNKIQKSNEAEEILTFAFGNNPEERIITLYEICKILGKEHNKWFKKIVEMHNHEGFGEVVQTATSNNNNVTIKTYAYTKKQALMVGARIDSSKIIALVNKIEALEKELKSIRKTGGYALDNFDESLKQIIMQRESEIKKEAVESYKNIVFMLKKNGRSEEWIHKLVRYHNLGLMRIEIAKLLDCSADTVTRYRKLIKKAGLI